MPPIPHIAVPAEAPPEAQPPPKPPKPRRGKGAMIGIGLAALLVLGGGGYFVWTTYLAEPPPQPIVTRAKAPGATKAATPATAASAAPPAAGAAATPGRSSVASKPAVADPAGAAASGLAHVPVNAINKAKDVVNARAGGDQAAAGAIIAGQEVAAAAKPEPPRPVVTTAATLAPGITATTTDVEAVPDAMPAFRTFVANAKITGVIDGHPPKIILNGRLARGGDVVDPGLGVIFFDVESDRKLIVFKDKTGAVVSRKY